MSLENQAQVHGSGMCFKHVILPYSKGLLYKTCMTLKVAGTKAYFYAFRKDRHSDMFIYSMKAAIIAQRVEVIKTISPHLQSVILPSHTKVCRLQQCIGSIYSPITANRVFYSKSQSWFKVFYCLKQNITIHSQ